MKTATDRYDLAGMGIGRTARRVLAGKLSRYWSCAAGLHLSQLLVLALRHWLGVPLAWLTLRYERHWMRLLAAWRRRRAPRRNDDAPGAAEK